MNRAVLFALLGFLFAAPMAHAACLGYEPALVRLSGNVVVKPFFGPPGFGKTPARDANVHHPILLLDEPVCVDATLGGAYNSKNEMHIGSMQMVFASYPFGAQWHGKHVAVTGTLFRAFTPDHHTDVLIMVAHAAEEDMR